MRLKKIFEGMAPYRFKGNPLEKQFALAWQEQNRTRTKTNDIHTTLAFLMSDDNTGQPEPMLTPRDWLVANTIIQWLGSPVGQAFLIKVLCKKVGFYARSAMWNAFKALTRKT